MSFNHITYKSTQNVEGISNKINGFYSFPPSITKRKCKTAKLLDFICEKINIKHNSKHLLLCQNAKVPCDDSFFKFFFRHFIQLYSHIVHCKCINVKW